MGLGLGVRVRVGVGVRGRVKRLGLAVRVGRTFALRRRRLLPGDDPRGRGGSRHAWGVDKDLPQRW